MVQSLRVRRPVSVEVPGKGVLEFMIQHRFGDINGGANSFFGLDNGATIRFGLGYSFNGRLEAGIGRKGDLENSGFAEVRGPTAVQRVVQVAEDSGRILRLTGVGARGEYG